MLPKRGAIPSGMPSSELNILAKSFMKILEKMSAVYSDYAWHYVGMLTEDHRCYPAKTQRASVSFQQDRKDHENHVGR